MSNYLEGQTELYGLPASLPAGLAEQASAIVDNYLKRPEGLGYRLDANGNPACMAALTPSFTYTIAAGVSPGTNVSVVVSPASVRPDMVGEVLVLDRVLDATVEAVVVGAVVGNNTLVLQNVQFSHAANCKADMGMVIAEERPVPAKRSIVRYAKFPCVGILSLMGRYGYGRRSDQVGGLYQEMNLLAAVQTFGGPPQWVPIPIGQASWSDATGEVWVPAGQLLAYYSDVKMRYVAGWPRFRIPDPIVRATAAIATSLMATSTTIGVGVRVISAGDTRIERFGATNLDNDTRNLLEPYKARTMF